jgi:hypothetical protein
MPFGTVRCAENGTERILCLSLAFKGFSGLLGNRPCSIRTMCLEINWDSL